MAKRDGEVETPVHSGGGKKRGNSENLEGTQVHRSLRIVVIALRGSNDRQDLNIIQQQERDPMHVCGNRVWRKIF